MTRAASLLERYAELSEASKYFNPVKANGPGNPYHDENGQFVSPDKAVMASKFTNSLKKTGSPTRFRLKGWKAGKDGGLSTPQFAGNGNMPAGPNVCGRTARGKGFDIRCHDGKVMGGQEKLKAAAARVRDAKAKVNAK